MRRVGSSVVSAITQTPASGPFGPVTTPPMSSPSIATDAPGACRALAAGLNHASSAHAVATIRLARKRLVVFISSSSTRSIIGGANVPVHFLLQQVERHGPWRQHRVVERTLREPVLHGSFCVIAQFKNFEFPDHIGARLTGHHD